MLLSIFTRCPPIYCGSGATSDTTRAAGAGSRNLSQTMTFAPDRADSAFVTKST
jgi:hypothetical protein